MNGITLMLYRCYISVVTPMELGWDKRGEEREGREGGVIQDR